MASLNPFGEFRGSCALALRRAVREVLGEELGEVRLQDTPSLEMGELGYPCFELAKKVGVKPRELAEQLAQAAGKYALKLIKGVEAAGGGYVNFRVNYEEFSELTLESIIQMGGRYGEVPAEPSLTMIVEHTSVNPVHPIHVGGARNSVLGDCLARILMKRGHKVRRHFYVDDVGYQVAQAAYGFKQAGMPEPQGKPDQFIGFIYAATNCAIGIRKLKEEIEELNKRGEFDRAREKIAELDDWVRVAAELREKSRELFDTIVDRINEDPDPDASISAIMKGYERGDLPIVQLVRRVCNYSIDGFKQTLSRVGIEFDSWDWESELTVWNGATEEVIEKLKETGFVEEKEGTLVLDVERAAQVFELKKLFNVKEDYEIPPLTLRRSDGTTLYTTRDIAYSLWKFSLAEKVINVISIEQRLPQLQLRIALYLLGKKNYAINLIHYGYELVHLPDYRMSGRRGRYVTFDQVLNEAVRRAYREVEKRSPHLSEEEKQRIAEAVGIGAVRYALVSVAASKPLTFTWDRVLDFERNSGPFLQYAYARAANILAKAEELAQSPDYTLLESTHEKQLILQLSKFPETVAEAADSLRPELIAEYANDLATIFNSFYDKHPVLAATPRELRDARLKLVEAVKVVMGNALQLMGITPLERM